MACSFTLLYTQVAFCYNQFIKILAKKLKTALIHLNAIAESWK